MKKTLLLMLNLILLILTAGCSNYEKTIYNTVNDLESVTVEIKEGTLSDAGLTVIIQNESEYECTFGEFYCIEKNIDNSWYRLPYVVKDDVLWNLLGYPIEENDTREFEIEWEWLYGKLKAGKYRIIKDFHIPVPNDDGDRFTNYYAAAEFTVK